MMNLFQGGDEAAGPADDIRVVALVGRGVQVAKTLSTDLKVQAELYETLGSIYDKLGKFDQADSLLRTALEQRKALFGASSPEVAETLIALGMLRSDQAHLEDAERLVREGLKMTKQNLPANHPAIGKATAALGTIVENRGVYDQGIPVLDEAVRLQSGPGGSRVDGKPDRIGELAVLRRPL
jgi:eukaryotic-like serine/threonine-protein kinase